MFESKVKIAGHIRELLAGFRRMSDARYVCVIEANGIVFEDPEPESREVFHLRRLLEDRRQAVLTLGRSLAADQPMKDVFEGWEHEELFVAVINEKVALVIACPEAESVRERAQKPLQALADRLFRYDGRYRINSRGGGFFFGRPRLDVIVIGGPQES